MSTFWKEFTTHRNSTLQGVTGVEQGATWLRDRKYLCNFQCEQCMKCEQCMGSLKYEQCMSGVEYEESMGANYQKSLEFLDTTLKSLPLTPELIPQVISAIESFFHPVNSFFIRNKRYDINFHFLLCELAKNYILHLDSLPIDWSNILTFSIPLHSSKCLRCHGLPR